MLLREEIADIVMRKVKNPHLGFVTVTDVELSEDLKIARVFVSVMSEGDQGATIEILNSARGLIRSEISRRVRVKFIPAIEFRIDTSIARGRRIDTLLKEIEEKRDSTSRPTEFPEE